MRSRTARVLIGAIAWIAFGGAALFLVHIEQLIAERRAAGQVFDARVRDVAAALADVRVAEQASVTEGQDGAVWTPRVEALVVAALRGVEELHRAAMAPAAQASLVEATAQIETLRGVDRRAREYLAAGDRVAAGNLVLAEGGRAAVGAGRLIDRAQVEERRAGDAQTTDLQQQRIYALGGALGIGALAIALLVFAPAARMRRAAAEEISIAPARELPTRRDVAIEQVQPNEIEDFEPLLTGAAEICTAFGRATEQSELTEVLGRAAALMDARGLIVWMGDAAGAALTPAITHGYSDQALARMPAILRDADNVAATAYRTGTLQIARARPDGTPGAIVAPMLSPEACIGALTAEVAAGKEMSLPAQALAVLFAAQIAGILAPPAPVSEAREDQAASA